MHRPIADIMEESLTRVGVDDTVEDVECILGAKKYSCVPVVDPDQHCFGIITSNDITKFHMHNRNPKKVRAWEICSHLMLEAAPELSIHDAAVLMIKNQVHHLVVTQDGEVKGIVSSIDLLEAYVIANHS